MNYTSEWFAHLIIWYLDNYTRAKIKFRDQIINDPLQSSCVETLNPSVILFKDRASKEVIRLNELIEFIKGRP